MSDLGTFGSFGIGRLGIYAAQQGLSVTGNNIANINTQGYTRRALNQASLRVGSHDRYQAQSNVSTGSGVLCVGVSQLRDPYLDIRYRAEASKVGALDGKLSGLEQISAILDEVSKSDGDGVVEKQLTELMKSLQNFSTENAGQDSFDSLVRSTATTLANLLNKYADDLDGLQQNTIKSLGQNMDKVNTLLNNIRDLNASIRESEIYGDSALDQRDQRNMLIDELAQQVKIDVTYTTEDIGGGQTVEKLVIKLGNANPDRTVDSDSATLVDGRYAAQLSYTQVPKPNPDFDPADPASLPYLDPDGNPTGNADAAAKVDSPNYNMSLSALADRNGQPLTSSKRMEISQADYDAVTNKDVTTTVTGGSINTKYIKDTVKVLAGIAKGGAAASAALDGVGLDRGALLATAAGAGLAGDGPFDIKVNYTGGKMNLLVGGTTIASSDSVTLPLDKDTAINFKLADGTSLGSVTVKKGTAAADLASASTGLQFTPEHNKDVYYKQVTTTSTGVDLDDNDLYGALQATRELLTEKGEFSTAYEVANVDENAAIKRGIPYYRYTLDALANQLATQFNKANSGYMVDADGYYVDADGKALTLPDPADPTKNLTFKKGEELTTAHMDALTAAGYTADKEGFDAFLTDRGSHKGGPLFSNHGSSDDTTDIRAGNISIAASWANGSTRIVNSFVCAPGSGEAASQSNDNIAHMITLMTAKFDYSASDLRQNIAADGTPIPDPDHPYLTGSFQEMLSSINVVLATDSQSTSTMLDNSYASAVELDTSRDSVSSVDLNDEAMNLMQYQKSYSAAARLITTLDEVLDKLINGTGIVGR